MFLFVVVSRQTKKAISLRPLWFDRAHHPESIEGRLCGYILKEFLFSPNLASFAALQLAPWNTDSTKVNLFAPSSIPQGE